MISDDNEDASGGDDDEEEVSISKSEQQMSTPSFTKLTMNCHNQHHPARILHCHDCQDLVNILLSVCVAQPGGPAIPLPGGFACLGSRFKGCLGLSSYFQPNPTLRHAIEK